jgi:hypothetical protein
MKYLPTNTLAYYQSAPQLHRHDLRDIPVKDFGQATKEYRKKCGQTSPDTDALEFYTLNHCAAIAKKQFTPNEPLPEWAIFVLKNYTDTAASQGKRMLHYILSICTQEMRHLHVGYLQDDWWNSVAPEMKKFICDNHEVEAVKSYMDHAPDATVGQFMEAMSYGFHKGKWSGGYGGHAWGKVADACVEFLNGKTSMEMLVDTGFTLAHNNGPIFNKGMMYDSYSGSFIKILDIQRSGQMPEYILDKDYSFITKSAHVVEAVQQVLKARPDEFRGWVDWNQVIKMGAKESYYEEISKQKKKHPELSPEKKKAIEKKLNGVKIKITGDWMVAPNQSVQVFERIGA